MCQDALSREESCGGHFREEHQYTDADPEVTSGYISAGEAKRHDDKFSHVSAWEYNGEGKPATLHCESLEFTDVKPSVRSYK